MPTPTPNTQESENEFMNRCVSFLINEGYEQDQATAICNSQWRKKNFEQIKTKKLKLLNNQTVINK